MHRLVVVALAFATGCATLRVDLAAMRAGAPAPAITGSKWMSVPFTSWTVVQLRNGAGAESPWMRVGVLYLDDRSVCVDADVPRWDFVVSVAVRGPDARAIPSITLPVEGVTIARAGADWVLRGEPAALIRWFQAHVEAIEDLERNEPGVQRAAYFVGMRGAIAWIGPSNDPSALYRSLSDRGMRLGWWWDDIREVRAWPGMDRTSTHADPAAIAEWLRTEPDPKTATGPKWEPSACPSGERARQRYAEPPT